MASTASRQQADGAKRPSSNSDDRRHIDGFEIVIFKLVQREATSEQWRQWLRVPLEHAAAKGNLDLFTRLMDAGADGEAGWRGCHGRTLLGAAACGNNSDKMVRALLSAGARSDVNVLFGAKRESALHVAAVRGAEKASKALMIAGADPNVRDSEGSSPLHLAAKAGHHHAIGSLLLKGADVHAKKTHAGETPLHLAASKGHTLCISELLLGSADRDVVNNEGETPLFKAAEKGHLGAIEELQAAGANGGIRANNHSSPLDIAARRGHTTVVKAVLDADSSAVDATNNFGWTALHFAASVHGSVRDNGDTVRVLLEAGADVNADTVSDGDTPLRVAVEYQASMGTIRALLEGGANVNVPEECVQRPLHIACEMSSVAAVELLLRWGADEKFTNGYESPADVIGPWKDNNDEETEADNQRIRQMLARAPADRSWRRRGWLVLSRSCPTRVQIANGRIGRVISSSNGCSAKVARVSGQDLGGHDEEKEDKTTVDWRGVVGRLVGLEADGVFRLVVGFL